MHVETRARDAGRGRSRAARRHRRVRRRRRRLARRQAAAARRSRRTAAARRRSALVENPDILATIARRSAGRPPLVVGFAAETEKVDRARAGEAGAEGLRLDRRQRRRARHRRHGRRPATRSTSSRRDERRDLADPRQGRGRARASVAAHLAHSCWTARGSPRDRRSSLSGACRTPRACRCPRYETRAPPGWTSCAALRENAPITDRKLGARSCRPGLVLQMPEGYEAQVRPRSGLALKHGVTVLNAPGTIDADYRGEVMRAARQSRRRAVRDHARHADRPARRRAGVARRARREPRRSTRPSAAAGGFGSTGAVERLVLKEERADDAAVETQSARHRGRGRHRAACPAAPVAAKHLAARHNLPPRHLETMLQALVGRHPEGRARPARRLRDRPRAPAHHGRRHRPRRHGLDGRGRRCRRCRNPRSSTRSSAPMVAERRRRPSSRARPDHRRGPVPAGASRLVFGDVRPTPISRSEHVNSVNLDRSREYVVSSATDRHRWRRADGQRCPQAADRSRAHAPGRGRDLRLDHRDDRRHARWCGSTGWPKEKRRRGQHPGQARVLQPDRQRQGPHRRQHDRGAGGDGRDQARRRR